MLLLAALVLTPAIAMLLITVRCVVAFIPSCDNSRAALFREWLAETVPVLVAIIMTGRNPPRPPGGADGSDHKATGQAPE